MTARVPLIACVAVLAFFAGITGVRLAYTLAYVLVLLLVVAYIWSRLLARKLRVTRESPQGSFMMGEPFEETFTVKNESGLRLPYCEVRDGTKLPGYAPGRAFALAAGGSRHLDGAGHVQPPRRASLRTARGAPRRSFRALPASYPGGAGERGDRLPGDPRAPAQRAAVERQRGRRGPSRPAGRRAARRVDDPRLRAHRRAEPHPLGVDGAHRAADQPHVRHRTERRPPRSSSTCSAASTPAPASSRRSSTRSRSARRWRTARSAAARRSDWSPTRAAARASAPGAARCSGSGCSTSSRSQPTTASAASPRPSASTATAGAAAAGWW